ncbi:MAG: roadblock/LC7 domain-containing protein [candidate division WOR-3 bacterium]
MESQVETILKNLIRKTPHIKAAAVINVEGISLASALEQGTNEESFGAMAAALLGLGENVLEEIKGGILREIYIKGEDKMVVIAGAGQEGVLAVSVMSEAPLGLILVEVRKAATEISKVISTHVDVSEIFGTDLSLLEGFSFTDLIGEEGTEK